MVSQETKNKAIKMSIAASFVFLVGSFMTKYMTDDYLAIPTLLFCLTLFFISGCIYVAGFLAILDDRKDFIKIVKQDFAYMYKQQKLTKRIK
jgi:hypothetical protein